MSASATSLPDLTENVFREVLARFCWETYTTLGSQRKERDYQTTLFNKLIRSDYDVESAFQIPMDDDSIERADLVIYDLNCLLRWPAFVLELKAHSDSYTCDEFRQLQGYMSYLHCAQGYLINFVKVEPPANFVRIIKFESVSWNPIEVRMSNIWGPSAPACSSCRAEFGDPNSPADFCDGRKSHRRNGETLDDDASAREEEALDAVAEVKDEDWLVYQLVDQLIEALNEIHFFKQGSLCDEVIEKIRTEVKPKFV